MSKRILAVAVAVALLYATAWGETVAPATKPGRQAQFAEKVKAGVAQLGVGLEARVTVKLRDKTKLAGYISEAREDSFVVTELSTGRQVPLAYTQVAQIKGHNLTSGQAITIGVVVAILVIAIAVAAALK